MKKINLSLFRKTFLIAILFSILNVAKAQDFVKELEKQYNVKIDSSFIKATPYKQFEKDGIIYDENKKIDYYNNITIYEIKSNSEKSKGEANREVEALKPAIFMLPGGGFFGHSPSDTDGMDLNGNLSLGSKLANNLTANIYMIWYDTNSIYLIQNVVFPVLNATCASVQNQTGKALLLEQSYKAFHDLRKILKVNYLDSAAQKQIDPNNFFMIGSSAGAVLAINTLFLQQSEISSTITFNNNCNNNNTSTITIAPAIRNEYWPIPTMKGIVSMAGAWIYDNVSFLTANTPATTYNTPLFLMHGTCDELISRREGNIGFKLPLNSFTENTNTDGRYISGKGSEYIFNSFKNTHNKMIYGQVKNGSHGVFSNSNLIPAWDVILDAANVNDPVTAQIKPFIEGLKNGTLSISTFTKVVTPEKTSNKCKPFDNALDTICFYYIPTPTISYNNNICHTTNYTATLSNLPVAPYTINWTSTGNVALVGAVNGTSVVYKSVNTSFTSGTLKATITRGCSSLTFEYLVNVNATKITAIEMASDCYSGIMGTTAREYPATSQILFFKTTYVNAIPEGVTTMQWELICGGTTYTSYVLNQVFGNNLQSSLILGPAPSGCTKVRVRYLRPCGQYTNWFEGNLTNCPGWVDPYLKVYPNPTNDYFSISLEEGKITESKEGIPVLVVDAMGSVVYSTTIFSTSEKIYITDLKPDVYKIVVTYQDKPYFSSLIKN